MNLNFQIGLTKTGSPLELLLKNGFHLIGEELLKFLSPSDISKLRKIFRDCNDLILNDCFFLFHSKIAPLLEPNSVQLWSLIIDKTVLRSKDYQASWYTSQVLTDIFFSFASPVFYQKKYLSFAFQKPLLTLIYNQTLGGSRVIFLIEKFLSRAQKRVLFDFCSSEKSVLHVIVQEDEAKLFPLFAKYVRKSHIKNESLCDLAVRYRSLKILRLVRRYNSETFFKKFKMKLDWFYL